jgi:hypothetical protein
MQPNGVPELIFGESGNAASMMKFQTVPVTGPGVRRVKRNACANAAAPERA